MIFMLRARKVEKGIGIYDPKRNTTFNLNFTSTTWEIIQALKKYGSKGAVAKIMQQFNIDEHNAKEDINTVLANLETLDITLEELPTTVSDVKYAPRTVQIDITPQCNSNCIYCLSSDLMSHNIEMSTEKILEAIKKLYDLDMYGLLLSGGEPLLRSDLIDILNYVDKLDIVTWLFTNGTLIDETIAKKLSEMERLFIQVSLDSSNSEHHEFQRGTKGSFEKTVNGIKHLIKYDKSPTVAITITSYNLDDLEETISFLQHLGVTTVRISTAWVEGGMGKINREILFLDSKKVKELGMRILKLSKQYNGTMSFSAAPNMFYFSENPELISGTVLGCDAGKDNLYITSNGDMYPCYTLAFPEFKAGNILQDDVAIVWKNSQIFKRFRQLCVKNFEKCNACSMIEKCEGGCRGVAYARFKSLTAPDPTRCSYFFDD